MLRALRRSFHERTIELTLLSRIATAVLIAVAIALLLPPFFTRGACTAEFEAATAVAQRMRPEVGTVALLGSYLNAHAMSYRVVPPERCESWSRNDDVGCSGGPVFLIFIPVQNKVCRYYRDDSIRIQLGFNSSKQLTRIQTDMKPFKYLKLPLGHEIAWAK